MWFYFVCIEVPGQMLSISCRKSLNYGMGCPGSSEFPIIVRMDGPSTVVW